MLIFLKTKAIKCYPINNNNTEDLHRIYNVPGIVLGALQLLMYLVFTILIGAIIILALQKK